MGRTKGFHMTLAFFGWLAVQLGCTGTLPKYNAPQALLVGDLEPRYDGKEVTIKFTVTELDGIAQRTKEEQAPSFAIETDGENQKNKLSVWVGGELANVLDRLQMGAFQDNALKAGTTISATGKLSVHKSIPNQYFLNVDKWQGFEIHSAKQDE